MSERRPWLKFYPQDWMGEPRLRACSLAARGLWMEMIALAHQATPYGHVLVNGSAPDLATLARLAGAGEAECESLIAELDRHGVFSRTRKGVIYSRRMIRDEKKSVHARKIGSFGGNPKLSNKRGNYAQDNPPDKGPLKPQIPEARYQRKKEASSLRSEGKKESPPPDPASGAAPQSAPRPAETTGPPKSTRGSRLQVSVLPDDWRLWALRHGHADPAAEFERFRDHWLAAAGQRGVKADWAATWRNWIRKAGERPASPGPPPNRPRIDHGRINDQLLAEARMLDAADRAIRGGAR